MLKNNLKELDHVSRSTLSPDGVKLLVSLYSMSDGNLITEEFMDEIYEEPIYQIFKKRVEAFDLNDKIDDNAILMSLVFNIDNPGVMMIYLISLLDYYDEYGKPATIKDISMEVFPNGFYDFETCIEIIDKLIKSNKLKNSYIY